jgi:hypothetical protein
MERRHFVAEMTKASVEYDAVCDALDNYPPEEKIVNHWRTATVMALVAVLIATVAWWLSSDEPKPVPLPIVSTQKNTVAEANQAPDLPLEPIVKTLNPEDQAIIQDIETAKRTEFEQAEAITTQALPPMPEVQEPPAITEEPLAPPVDYRRCSKCLKSVAGLGVPGKEYEYCAEFCS